LFCGLERGEKELVEDEDDFVLTLKNAWKKRLGTIS
jgi:hypothetical protein